VKTAAFAAALAAVVAGAFFAGRCSSSGAAKAPAASGASASAAPAAASGSAGDPSGSAVAAPIHVASAPRRTPPPLPDNDPQLRDWLVNGTREPPDLMVHQRDAEMGQHITDVFGADFPKAKRDALLDAQHDAARRSGYLAWDYYHGDIDQDQAALRLHQIMLAYGQSVQGALTGDEYQRWMKLPAGADPYSSIMDPSARPFDPFPGAPDAQPAP
jgi:hypothetical protein